MFRLQVGRSALPKSLGFTDTVVIMRARSYPIVEDTMSENSNSKSDGDGVADAIAVTAIITIVILTMYVWLSGMPS